MQGELEKSEPERPAESFSHSDPLTLEPRGVGGGGTLMETDQGLLPLLGVKKKLTWIFFLNSSKA